MVSVDAQCLLLSLHVADIVVVVEVIVEVVGEVVEAGERCFVRRVTGVKLG